MLCIRIYYIISLYAESGCEMKRKLPETITEEEFHKLFNLVNDKKKKLAYSLGFYQCMRISEVIKLRPEHIDKGAKLIRIKQAKGGKDRNIPIHPKIMRGLEKYLPIGCGIRALQIHFKKNANKILKRDLHFHCLRHSGATHYLNKKKWNIRQVQQFLGHSSISTTEIYTHVSPQELVDLMWEER